MLFFNKTKITAAVISLTMLVSGFVACPIMAEGETNLIQNGDFETKKNGMAYLWWGYRGFIGQHPNNPTEPKKSDLSAGYGIGLVDKGRTGNAAEAWGGSNPGQLATVVAVEQYTSYELRFWYKEAEDKTAPTVTLMVENAKNLIDTSLLESDRMVSAGKLMEDVKYTPTSEWQEGVVTFNSGDSTDIAVVLSMGQGNGNKVWYDDFLLYKKEPVAENVVMSGYPSVGQTLKVYGDTKDDFGGIVQPSQYKWQISDDNIVWNDIEGAEEQEYTVADSDKGRYIRGGIVPVVSNNADGSGVRTGKTVYAQGIQIISSTTDNPQKISASGMFIGTSEEAAELTSSEGTIDGYIIATNGLVIENNAIMYDGIAYVIDLNADDRAVLTGSTDFTVDLNEENIKSVNVLMANTQSSAEQKVVLTYTDGTTEEKTYTSGMLYELTSDLNNINTTALGLYATSTAEGTDKTDAGFLYSYTFETNKTKKIKSITFKQTASDNTLILAVTSQKLLKDEMKEVLETNIKNLENFKYADIQDLINVFKMLEVYVELGGTEADVSGIDTLNALQPYVDFDISMLDVQGTNTTFNKIYSTMSETGRNAVKSVVESTAYNSYDDFVKGYKEEIILKGIQYPLTGGTAYVADIVTSENAAAIGMSASEYLASSNKTASNDAVAKQEFATIAALEEAIKPKTDGSGSPSSYISSGGGSYSSTATGGTVIPIPTDKDNTEETALKMFTDITEEHWLFKELYKLKELGIISGDESGQFNPYNLITREEFVKILCLAFEIQPVSGDSDFTDVVSGAWYVPYINAAVKAGAVNGISEDTFGIGKNITRQDICTMLYRMIKKDDVDIKRPVFKFADRDDIAKYAIEAVEVLQMAEIVSGYEDSTFRPNENCTREHAAKIVFNVLQYIGRLTSDNI